MGERGQQSLDDPLWFPIAVFTNEKFLYGPFVRMSNANKGVYFGG